MTNDSSFDDAKRLYLEQYGDPMVTNTYLKIALVLLVLVAISLGLIDLRTIRTFQNFRPLVIRIDQLGRAEAHRNLAFEARPDPPLQCRRRILLLRCHPARSATGESRRSGLIH